MQRRRIHISGLSDEDRERFLVAFVARFTRALALRFPSQFGYVLVWENATSRLHITRGNFMGLSISLERVEGNFDVLEVRFESFFPCIERFTRAFHLYGDRYQELPGAGRFFLGHLFGGLLLVVGLALLPFYVAYRMALLLRTGDAQTAAHVLDSLGPEIQATWGGAVSIRRRRSPLLAYTFAMAVASTATFASFWLAGRPGMDALSTWLYVLGGILALISVVLLIAWVLMVLGFRVT